MRSVPARIHLLILITVAIVPVWLFAAYLLAQYALSERERFRTDAIQVAYQVSLVVESDLQGLARTLEWLSRSQALQGGDLIQFAAEARRLAQGVDKTIILQGPGGLQLLNTGVAPGSEMPAAISLSGRTMAEAATSRPFVGEVYLDQVTGAYHVPIGLRIAGPQNASWTLIMPVPTADINHLLMPAVPAGWLVGIGDERGIYVSRSQMHDEMTGKAGLPEYLEKVVGSSGSFTSQNFQGTTILAGYSRAPFSGWFYSANVPLAVVRAPLRQSLVAIGALGILAMLISSVLAYVVGNRFTSAAHGLAQQASMLGQRKAMVPVRTSVAEFAVIADALAVADEAIDKRARELEAVVDTVPAAVWFTYDPTARMVIRNRFAADLMGIPRENVSAFGIPDHVTDTVAIKDGREVPRDDRPLTRAMRGEQSDNEEYVYILPNGVRRVLLTSARSIRDPLGNVVGAVQISLDISERKRGEEQRQLLVNELNHRVKNTLAVVQSLATQTLRSATGLGEANDALVARLTSLAKAHDVLTSQNWSGAYLETIVRACLITHASEDRFTLRGPVTWLPPALSLSLALALHELATNALKYGALSNDTGIVALSWTVDEGDRLLRIEWREQGGPPVQPQTRHGFGTKLLRRVLDAERSGSVTLDYDPAGLVCVLEAGLGEASEPGEMRFASAAAH